MNLAIISGVVDSEVSNVDFSNGGGVSRFRVKTSETFTIDGETKERSQTHLIDVYSDYLRNGIVKTLAKGHLVELQGAIQSRNTASEGQPARWVTSIVLRTTGVINVVGGARALTTVSASAEERGTTSEPRIDHSRRKQPSERFPDDGLDNDVPF